MPVLFGAYSGNGNTDYQTLETKLGHKLAIVQRFFSWGEDPDPFLNAVGDRMPLVTIEPERVSWASIASGSQDAYLNLLAARTKAYGRPVYFRIGPEMNGDWASWMVTSTGIPTFRAAWARIASIVRPAGGKLVWCPNDVSSPGLPSPTTYYPGSAQVDIIGIDSYPWDDGRTSFDQLTAKYYPIYSGLDPSKDVWICETGCNQVPVQATWIVSMIQSTAYPNLRAVVYFNTVGNRDWRLLSQETIDAVKAALISPAPSRRHPRRPRVRSLGPRSTAAIQAW